MSAPATIRADGIEWPLQTFLDAYGYRPADPADLPRMDGQVRLATVTKAGELRPPMFADQVGWYDVLAFRPLEGAPESTPYRLCGDAILRTDSDDICVPCEDAAEWWS